MHSILLTVTLLYELKRKCNLLPCEPKHATDSVQSLNHAALRNTHTQATAKI